MRGGQPLIVLVYVLLTTILKKCVSCEVVASHRNAWLLLTHSSRHFLDVFITTLLFIQLRNSNHIACVEVQRKKTPSIVRREIFTDKHIFFYHVQFIGLFRVTEYETVFLFVFPYQIVF